MFFCCLNTILFIQVHYGVWLYCTTTKALSPRPQLSDVKADIFLVYLLQVPVAPLQRTNGPPFLNQAWQNESHEAVDVHTEGVPTLITWNSGGNDVAVEGSWDNWRSR